ncbi:thiosulfate ABC transporter substrate-binding protein CysP [Alkalimonas collagenimarina]|uniref:Thiosulfate ABC transporter substrate-binding protein CysP n=1 Tax=Alkalimonas collagenimarina TaxID=400390 RepID=A0ABT9GZY9_9GAMM|nr:thiosulfate ABC transporter substrate-binding protein CysP [Alkalimonas collagenimarina]MDP4536631.1 thiosulfate ABC transporter substrate-binding protein CysP [Alkalimonas collagenimarina]
MRRLWIPLALVVAQLTSTVQAKELLNSSYDIARELFADINPLFVEHWQQQSGETLTINQSHGGSSRQAQAIIQGLRADVVTFNQSTDIDILHQRGNLLPENWRERLPNNASPYYSTMAFLVRKGNPKGIETWEDLTKEGVTLVFPNPKTSGNARYTYLAAYGDALQRFGDDRAGVRAWVAEFLSRVAVFDTGGRGATTSFIDRNLGDVLITFESEVNNIIKQYPDLGLERVVPPTNVLAEFPVAWIDRNVARNGTEQQAKAYLEFLYSEQAQRRLASFYYRVHHEAVKADVADQFPATELFHVEDVFGSWEQVNIEHFANNAELDKLLSEGRRRR